MGASSGHQAPGPSPCLGPCLAALVAEPEPEPEPDPSSDTAQIEIETILHETERKALVAVLRARPEVTLESLQACFGGPYGATLRTITVGELLEASAPFHRSPDGGPPIDRTLLEQAKRSSGEDYDQLVCQAILAASGRSVSASYLRARVGGPRWKLQASLRRLVDAGQIERKGITSSTRYRPGRAPSQPISQPISQPSPVHAD